MSVHRFCADVSNARTASGMEIRHGGQVRALSKHNIIPLDALQHVRYSDVFGMLQGGRGSAQGRRDACGTTFTQTQGLDTISSCHGD